MATTSRVVLFALGVVAIVLVFATIRINKVGEEEGETTATTTLPFSSSSTYWSKPSWPSSDSVPKFTRASRTLAAFKNVSTILDESRTTWKVIPKKMGGATPKILLENRKTGKQYVFKGFDRRQLFKIHKEIGAGALKRIMFGNETASGKGVLIAIDPTVKDIVVNSSKKFLDKGTLRHRNGVPTITGTRLDAEEGIVNKRNGGCKLFEKYANDSSALWLFDMMVNNGDRNCNSNRLYSRPKDKLELLDFDGGPVIKFDQKFCFGKTAFLSRPFFSNKKPPKNVELYCQLLAKTMTLLSEKFPPFEEVRKLLFNIFLDDEWLRLRSESISPELKGKLEGNLGKALGLAVMPDCVSNLTRHQAETQPYTTLLPAFLADVYARRAFYLRITLEEKYQKMCRAPGI